MILKKSTKYKMADFLSFCKAHTVKTYTQLVLQIQINLTKSLLILTYCLESIMMIQLNAEKT